MTYYVFAIGGTGARCLESLVHLCAMGIGPTRLHPILVDPDIGNGNLNRTIKLINLYKGVRSQIENPVEGSLFYTDIIFEDTDAGIDIKKKIVERFDPYGNVVFVPTGKLDEFLKKYFEVFFPDYTYLAPSDALKGISMQV